jgi:hypothetical protein
VPPFFASLAQRIAAAVVFVAVGAIGFLPLFGGPGYEHSLASGVVVPSAAAIATAVELSGMECPGPLAGVARGLASGAALALVALVTAMLHGLRVGFCDLVGGVVFFVLTAGFGALLGGVWGALVAEVGRHVRRRRLVCVLLALAGPVAGIAVSVARFYSTPIIFAFDPFFGYFSGALYDTVVDVRAELWSYRGGTLATIAAVVFFAAALRRPGEGLALRPRRAPGGGRVVACLVLGACAAAASAAVGLDGAALGHWQTASTITHALGGRRSGPRCDVVYPQDLLDSTAALLLRDCEEELAADEHRLGAQLPGRLTEFVFLDAAQKRSLMGAAETSIAKPWRREVYIQLARYPHPVLGHEIAHVVAGSFAPGPFHVGGGLWPNPGLIEGIAVATSPDDDELTDGQWARAMLDLHLLPPARSLFSLDFLGASAAKSYTVAGAFVGWALERWGTATVRAWYGGASLEALTNLPWPALDEAFHEWLRSLPMPPQASAYARARFAAPGVWGRRCPHVVDALVRDAVQCQKDLAFRRAAAFYARALASDPGHLRSRVERARLRVRYGDADDATRARAELERLVDDGEAPRTWRDRAEEALADDALSNGRIAEAVAAYRDIAERVLDEDLARTLEVKALGAEDPGARRAVIDLLIGSPGHAQDAWVGGVTLGLWTGASSSALGEYLVGKNYGLREEWVRAAEWLDRARESGPPTPRIGRELLRERAIDACAIGDRAALVELTKAIDAEGSPFAGTSGGRREWLLRLIARCS